MLMNMFNNLDTMIFNIPINWFFFINIFFFIKMNKFINQSNIFKLFLNKINKEIFFNNKMMNKSLIYLFSFLMMLILMLNLINILPFNFSPSNNFMMSIFFSIKFNFMMIFFNLKFNKMIFFMKMIPKNTPIFMLMFIFIIEINSMFTQILIISIRLMINMMLSHLIMNIINNLYFIFNYMIMEIFIITIQSYIFFILILLNSNNMY